MRKIICLLLAACGWATLIGFSTSIHSPGITEDGLRYLSMAHHAAAGKGFSLYNPSIAPVSLPYISQAPLWSALIAPGLAAGFRAETWTWVLLTVLTALNLWIAGAAVLYGTRSLVAGLAVQILLLSDRHWLTHHAYVLSEPLFLLLTFVFALTLWLYLNSGRIRWLTAAAAAAGLAGVTRFIGAAYAPAIFASVMLLDSAPLKTRLSRALSAGFFGALPLSLWFLRHYLLRREWFGMHVAESQTGHFFPAEVASSFLTETMHYPMTNGWLPDRPGFEWVLPTAVAAVAWMSLRQTRNLGASEDFRKHGTDWIFPIIGFVYAAAMIGVWTLRSVRGYPDPGRFSLPMLALLWIWGWATIWNFLSDRMKTVGDRPSFSFRTAACRCAAIAIVLGFAAQLPPIYGWMVQAIQKGEYGRPDNIGWSAANRIAWFPSQAS